MQISTREEDFIIDTLELRSEMYILNEAFTDPAIVKVMEACYKSFVPICRSLNCLKSNFISFPNGQLHRLVTQKVVLSFLLNTHKCSLL